MEAPLALATRGGAFGACRSLSLDGIGRAMAEACAAEGAPVVVMRGGMKLA
ncbi:MAG: hypothetical protein WBJ62_05100 [Coriobacteriia bacterium]